MANRFFDSHAHLADPSFNEDLSTVMQRAQAARVDFAIIADSIAETKDILQRIKPAITSVGVHSHYADQVTEATIDEMHTLYKRHNSIRAIGEMGLDTVRSKTTREQQLHAFRLQVELAKELNAPMILHCREAFDDLFMVLDEIQYYKGVMHCFTGNSEYALRATRHELHISFSGIITYPKNSELREVAKIVPEELLLIETDSPYLPPEGLRGQRNEPVNVNRVAEALAETLHQPIKHIAEITTANALRLYDRKDFIP